MSQLHPIVVQLKPSEEQAPAILMRNRNVVVTAGAGTGKTRTLVARYLSLLSESVAPEKSVRNIVAITFTEKAAREMRNRVRQEVATFVATLSGDERVRWEKVYAALDAARISTFHGLSAEILRNHPAEAGVDPRFDILDEARANLLKGNAIEQTLAWIAETPEMTPLLRLRGERDIEVMTQLAESLRVLLNEPSKTADIFSTHPDTIIDHWQTVLTRLRENGLRKILSDPNWQAAVATVSDIQPLDPKGDDNRVINWRTIHSAIESNEIEQFVTLGTLNLRGGSQKAWASDDDSAEVHGAIKTIKELWKSKEAQLLGEGLNELDEVSADFLPLLHTAYTHALALYDGYKQTRNDLDFSDLEALALDLLKTEPAVRLRWQEEVHALLVDEFQDTNRAQRDFVKLLSGERNNLFFVGDAKQSIYRFRGADVTLFREERQGIAHNGRFELSTSYRTHEGLLGSLNSFFRETLGEHEDANRPWHEPFAPLTAFRADSETKTPSPHIELHLAVGSKAEQLEHAASMLVNRLLDLVKDADNQLDFGDIAILCRTANAFQYYENALSKAAVPYITIAGQGLYERPEIRDLLNMLHAITTPDDDLPFIGLLRSPVFGFSDQDLIDLTQARDTQKGDSLWSTLPSFPHPNRAHVVAVVAELNALSGKISVADLLKRLLSATDYVSALHLAGDARSARNVEKLLHDAHGSGAVYVGEFLELIENLRQGNARAGEARSAAKGVVQLMTVHQSKGLEFPAVVIGDASYARRNTRRDPLLDDELGLLLPLKEGEQEPTLYKWGRLLDNDKETAEDARLLYVAATRARDHLLVSSVCQLNNKGTHLSNLRGWLKEFATITGLKERPITGYDVEGRQVHPIPLSLNTVPITCNIYEPHVTARKRGAPVSAAPSAPAESVSLLAPISLPDPDAEERPESVWRIVPEKDYKIAPAWIIGTLVHQALAAWYFPSDSEAFDRWAQSQLRSFGLTSQAQLTHALTQTKTLLTRFQATDLYQTLRTATPRLHEVPFAILDDAGNLKEGYIDLMYWHEDAWTIVDFKTDRIVADGNRTIDSILRDKAYAAQLARYRAAAQAFLGEPPRTLLCFLDDRGEVTEREV